MTSRPISSILRMEPGRLRSVKLDRDLLLGTAAVAFVPTPFARWSLGRIARGLRRGAVERAWRITGDYGSGKSSLALALSRMAGDPRYSNSILGEELVGSVRLHPIVCTGRREAIGRTLLRGLRESLDRADVRPDRRLRGLLQDGPDPETGEVLEAVERASRLIRATGVGDGLLIVLDELGKNLEHAAWSAGRLDDVFLLQLLAEAAARSGDEPLMVVAILHQSVAGYAAALPSVARREWEKVAGRFEEVVYAPPLAETAMLVASAIDVKFEQLPASLMDRVSFAMHEAIAAGWYGPGVAVVELHRLAPALFPLDPTVLPVLAKVFRRFGQNERSLFGFVASSEPHGLLDYCRRPLGEAATYRVSDLYDYVSANLSGALSIGPANSRWSIVSAVIGSMVTSSQTELEVLKTVGILNVLDDPGLPSDLAAVSLAVSGRSDDPEVAAAVSRLSGPGRVLHRRGGMGALSLWPNTSVDLEGAFRTGLAAGASEDILRSLLPALPAEPLVARRHYVETGALRHFERRYVASDQLDDALSLPLSQAKGSPDGRILIILTRDDVEHADVVARIDQAVAPLDPRIVVAVPRAVGSVAPALRDVQGWRWVRDNVEGLSGDRFARDEVTRQIALSTDRLARAVAGLVDGGADGSRWYGCGRRLAVAGERDLLIHMSSVCERAFDRSPKIRNELINRRNLSSAAARARSIVIEGLAAGAHLPDLGIPSAGTPPERAIYLSVLRQGRVHVQRGEAWAIVVPDEDDDPLRLRPALLEIHGMLTCVPDARVGYEQIVERLRGGRYAVRDGLIPLLVAIYVAANWHRTAVYEDGTYLEQVGGPEFMRIVKEPEHFDLQHCSIDGVRAEVFGHLAEAVGVQRGPRPPELLDVVRPLSRFVASVPDYARRTKRMSASAIAVRKALLTARDPAELVFSEMPRACGIDPIGVVDEMPSADAAHFVSIVRGAVREMRDAYPDLLDRLFRSLASSLDMQLDDQGAIRADVAERARRLESRVNEVDLRSFLLRLSDAALDDRAWLESLASGVARKPPERWTDADEAEFEHRLPILAARLRRVEATAFGAGAAADVPGDAYRIVVTASDGREMEDVLRPAAVDADELAAVEDEMREFLRRHGRTGAFAAARMLLNGPEGERE